MGKLRFVLSSKKPPADTRPMAWRDDLIYIKATEYRRAPTRMCESCRME